MEPPITLISGAGGHIGSALLASLRESGVPAYAMVRRDVPFSTERREVGWNPETGKINLPKEVEVDTVFHLAAASVLRRWTRSRKALIRHSRINYTSNIAHWLAARRRKPAAFILAAGYGFYGSCGSTPVTEEAPASDTPTFLATAAREWEDATAPAADAGIRVANMRIGAVLHHRVEFIRLTLPFIKIGMGATIGNGYNYIPWIMLEDTVNALRHTMDHKEISGPVNVAAPEAASQKQIVAAIARAAGRSLRLHVPIPLARFVMGEITDGFFTSSCNLVPKVLEQSGFKWRYPTLEAAAPAMLAGH